MYSDAAPRPAILAPGVVGAGADVDLGVSLAERLRAGEVGPDSAKSGASPTPTGAKFGLG